MCAAAVFGINASAESTNYNNNMPFYSYTYNEDDEAVQTPAPYATQKVLLGSDLGVEDFGALSDVFFDSAAEKIYLTDKDSGIITVLDKDFKTICQITSFINNGAEDAFKTPGSVCVRNGNVYVADTGNSRIVILDAETYQTVKVLGKPQVKLLDENYTYSPSRIAVDLAGRIYVIAADINDGIFLLDKDGNFIRFAAAPDVKVNLWNKFLKLFMTKAQKAQLEKSVPTEYNSFLMDENGFLYLTSSDSTVHPITKLNSQGNDILNYEGDDYPDGDSSHVLKKSEKIISSFVDIAVRDDGIYASLDTTKGRIFVYDKEGNLLYCFGGIGTQDGLFYSPSALELFDDKLIVTDSFYGTLTVFKRTEFGTAVDTATGQMVNGQYSASKQSWQEVERLCPAYDSANINLARIDIQEGNYSAALKKLSGSSDFNYYSKAFKGYRKEVIKDNFYILAAAVIILLVFLIIRPFLKRKLKIKERLCNHKLYREISYSSYTMLHPFDGYWDLKREKRGSLAAANMLTFLFVLAYALRAQFSGYLFTGRLPSEINGLYETAKIIIPLGLWIVSNWCFTTLMDGEGTMKDIYIATAYSLKPYIITAVPLWLLSRCLTEEEAFIYTALNTIVTVWMLALIFFGMMVTHDYSLSKGIITAILTLIGICLILFIALTFTNIIQKIYDFAADIYNEFSYRMT